jgi:hypothetical protein
VWNSSPVSAPNIAMTTLIGISIWFVNANDLTRFGLLTAS